jgi:hypothetical protein
MWVKNDKNEMVGQTTQNEKKREKEKKRDTQNYVLFFSHSCVNVCSFIYYYYYPLKATTDDTTATTT